MSALDLEVQPVQVAEVQYAEESLDDSDSIPDVKSGVRIDPNAAMQSARFKKTDLVHMPQVVNGIRGKAVFSVYRAQYNPKGYVEYQLADILTGKLHRNGAWVREKELKLERRG